VPETAVVSTAEKPAIIQIFSKERDSEILRDLLTEVFTKFEYILKAHEFALKTISHVVEV
jgi:hypothetical protein